MLAGTGGSETFTAGHVRELVRRNIAVQIAIVGPAVSTTLLDFPDLPIVGLAAKEEISDLAGTVVFINQAYDIPTRNKSAIILHCVVPSKVELH